MVVALEDKPVIIEKEYNCDLFKIRGYNLTPEGYLNTWLISGIANEILNYPNNRRETITEDSLFNEKSISTGVGKPISYNHPGDAITSVNHGKYAKGVILQQYEIDSTRPNKALAINAMIHDKEIVDKVLNGDCKYISAAYTATKVLNKDGIYEQIDREYNHFAVLDELNFPRAGEYSSILRYNKDGATIEELTEDNTSIIRKIAPMPQTKITTDSGNLETEETATEETATEETTKTTTTTTTMQVDAAEISERVELLSNWKGLLDEKKKAIDYNMDSNGIKRLILSCYYPEKTMNSLTKDSLLEGFWLGFVANQNQINTDAGDDSIYQEVSQQYRPVTPASKTKTFNFDSAVDEAVNKYNAKLNN